MLPKTGVIYLSEKLPDGNRVTILVEETPDDLTVLPAFRHDPRQELTAIAEKPVVRRPRTDIPYPAARHGYPPVAPVRRPASMTAFRTMPAAKSAFTASVTPAPQGPAVHPDPVTKTPHIRQNPVVDLDVTLDAASMPRPAGSSQPHLPPAVTIPVPLPSVPDSVKRAVPDEHAGGPNTAGGRISGPFPHARPAAPVRGRSRWSARKIGLALLALSLGGITAPLIPKIRLETYFAATKTKTAVARLIEPVPKELPPAAPVLFDPLVTPDGQPIKPVNTDFAIIVPKIGINAPVTAGVDPGNPAEYKKVLSTSVAHAKTSYLPDQNGTVYLFSHSTNYDWFVKDLNAVFYLLKNLDTGDYVVVFYKGVRYTYAITQKRVVKPNQISYLSPHPGEKKLILQTCWPPGSIAERLLLFADLVEEQSKSI